jgi:hypothetical protein
MTDLEKTVLSRLRDFGGESSAFLMTNPDGPWGELGNSDTLLETIKSLHAQGTVVHDADKGVVTIA